MIRVYKGMLRDMPHVTNLDVQTQEFALDAEEVKQWFIQIGKAVYLAQLGKREVGFALMTYDKEKGTAFIDRVGTHPSFRQAGVGRRLVERVVLEATTESAKKVQMIVPNYAIDDKEDPWNIEQWLWKLGFKAVGVLTDHFHRYGRDYDGYVFERMKS